MAQINSCLKRVFLKYIVVLALLGGILIGLTVLSHVFTNNSDPSVKEEDRTTGLIVLYVIGAGTMLIALLGAYAAYRENIVCLIVFLVILTSLGALLTIQMTSSATFRQQMEEDLEQRFRKFLPLNTASPEVKQMVVNLQTPLHCCGLFSYRDWNNQFPDSCSCLQSQEDQCISVDYPRNRVPSYNTQSKSVYSKPCFPIFKQNFLLGVNIIMGVYFTLTALVVLGAVLSSVMIYQLRQPNSSTVPLSDPTTDQV